MVVSTLSDPVSWRYQDMETAESMAEKLHGFRVYHPDDRTRPFGEKDMIDILLVSWHPTYMGYHEHMSYPCL